MVSRRYVQHAAAITDRLRANLIGRGGMFLPAAGALSRVASAVVMGTYWFPGSR